MRSPLSKSARPGASERVFPALGLAALAALGPGCSTLPSRGYPPGQVHDLVIDYELGGPGAVQVPSSTDRITVFELEVEPRPARESFAGGRRMLHFDDADRVRCRCRYRVRAPAGEGAGALPLPAELFPGAKAIRSAEASER